MSTVSVAGLGMYTLLYMAVGALKTASEIKGWMQGKDFQDRDETLCSVEELAKKKEALKKKIFDDIAAELGRVGDGGGARKELREGLESLRKSVDERLENGTETVIVDELNSLKRKFHTVELDDAQCRSRTDSVRRLIETLRALDAPSYKKELDRLEGEFERISVLPAENRMYELQGMSEELRELEKFIKAAAEADIGALEEHRYVFEPREAKDRRRIVWEIRDWADRIAQLDEIEGERLHPVLEGLNPDSPFPDRLARLREQVKTTWGAVREKAASTAFFREKLSELSEILQVSEDAAGSREGSELIRRCATACGGKFIDREFFMTLYEDISRFVWSRGEEIADAIFVQKAEKTLAELGYELLTDDLSESTDLRVGQIRYLESPYEGYRVMVKVDSKGAVTTRLVRVVADEEEKNAPAADQRQKDLETGKKWCRDLDGFFEKMREQGLPLDVTLRREPEEDELLIVVDKNARGRKRKRRKGDSLREGALREKGAEIR